MRRHVFIAVILGLLLTLNAGAACGSSVVLSFSPTESTVTVGDSFAVALVISGLDSSLGLGAYDFSVEYSPGVLTPVSVAFGSFLGNPSDSLANFTFLAGIISIDETSFLSALDQPETFTLARLSFHALAVGTSLLTFSEITLSDSGANPIDYETDNGQVTVNTVVPLPSALWFLGSGVIVLFRLRKKATRDA